MATVGVGNEQIAAGRAAADRLAEDWENRDWVPFDATLDWARAAVTRLGEIIAGQPSMLRASMKGADKGASTLSPRPFQGIVECLQNADDLGATRLLVIFRESPRPELLIIHDGSPVTLANVGAMLLPWLSTKDGDPDAAGRFGIGQKTLSSLGTPIELHAAPFHFIMCDEGPIPCTPEPDISGVYEAARRDTMLIIPLRASVTSEHVADAVRELDVDALFFLKSIRNLEFHNLGEPSRDLLYSVEVTAVGEGKISFGDEEAEVAIADVAVIHPVESRSTQYRRYSTRRTVMHGEKRSNKATGVTTPIAICVPVGPVRPLRLYDRMPLPLSLGLTIGLDAQFDPDSARSTLQPIKWNRNRLADLGQLVAWAALRAFNTDTVTAWNHVPLLAECREGGEWVEENVREQVVSACYEILREKLRVSTRSGPTPLDEIVYETEDLENILTEADLVSLRPQKVALPHSGRDSLRRWRRVLADLGLSAKLEIANALDILDGDPGRGADWYISFAVLAEREGLFSLFAAKPAIFLADGSVCARPASSDIWVFVKQSAPKALAARLGLARTLHPAYLEPDAPIAAFVANLENASVLFDDRNAAADVFSILGRGLWGGDGTPIRLEDGDLLAMRDAWEGLPRERHAELGPKVGRRIELRAFWYGSDGRRNTGWGRPVDLYLPAAIDREVDSFAKAAGRAPGLWWVDPEYAKLLKHKAGRSAIGGQRLLTAWGVAREPRLIKPKDEVSPWVRDPRRASPVATAMRTPDQLQSIRANTWITHLLEDHWSPDADAVAADIATAPIKTRRKRAMAFLATLSRAWERRYSDFTTAIPAYAYNGYWHASPEVRSTWLARLADVKWMPDAGSGVQRPASLQLQVLGSTPRPSERSSTVAKFDAQILRSGILAALGVKAGPTQRDLVERLRQLRAVPPTPSVNDDVSIIYQLLAASVRDRRDAVPEGRMTEAQLRNSFRAGPDGPGLLLVEGQWLSPETVLRGPAIFGARRAFAPHVEGLDPLWKTLGVELPNTSHAVAVLKEIAETNPSPIDLGIAIRAFSLIAASASDLSTQMRTALKRLPVWIGTGWTTDRPVYALEGEALLANAPAHLKVWQPGVTSFATLAPLLGPLGIIRLSPSDFRVVSTPAYGLADGEPLRPIFARAVALLKQELVRADQSLLDGLTVDWDELLAAPVIIDPDLSIVAELASGVVSMPATAHIGRDPLRLVVRSSPDVAAAEGGGAAVASLFAGDRQKAAWAWAAVWPRAAAGEQAAGAILPKTRAAESAAKDRLEKLGRQAAARQGTESSKKATPTKATVKPVVVQVRKLRDLGDLEPSAGVIVNKGAKPSGGLAIANRRAPKERRFGATRATSSSEIRTARTVLPPSGDRESMAFEAVRRALRLDVKQLNDLRNARGVGVDAIDDLRQCYEIKMNSGIAMPADVTLTASEVEAARNDPDFFLAIVTGLEDGAGELRVRFIFDPLTNLDVRIRGDVTLTGVDKAEALEFSFSRRD